MGSLGECCCDPCSECSEVAALNNWSVSTLLNGFALSGAFGPMAPSCKRFGYGCNRIDESIHHDYEEQTSFNPSLASSSLLWATGCNCGEVSYTGERYQTRRADRWRFWLSNLVSIEVNITHPSSTSIKLVAYVNMVTGATATKSLMIQRRRFDVSGNCDGTGTTYGTPTDPGVLAAPDPALPCVPILSDVSDIQNSCPPPPLNTQIDPCIESDSYTKSYSLLVPSGYTCSPVDRVATLEMLRTEQCCQDFCRSPLSVKNLVYESAVINCSEIPSSIPLNVVGTPGPLIASWRNVNCGLGFFPSFYPSDLYYYPPSTILMQLT